MYQQKLVCAVKHNGRVLREHGDTVYIPFGSEYSLHFKNLNSVRALVRVSVDGQDATEGTSLIVPANGTVELERFIKNGNLSSGHKFKFIERTSKIENGPRGIKAEDGLVRIEFEFERQPAKIETKVEYETIKRTYIEDYWRVNPRPTVWLSSPTVRTTPWNPGEIICSTASLSAGVNGISASDLKIGSATTATYSSNASIGSISNTAFTSTAPAPAAPKLGKVRTFVPNVDLNVAGITVAGSESDQTFTKGEWFPTDGQKHVMVLKLLGMVGEQVVTKPVTVKTKQECPTCGTKNKHGTKFCRECGTNLAA